MTPYELHRHIEAYRARMHRLAAEYGLSDPRVLRMSQRLDKLIVLEMSGCESYYERKEVIC